MNTIILKNRCTKKQNLRKVYNGEKNILIHYEAFSQTLNPQLPNNPPYCHIHCYYSCVDLAHDYDFLFKIYRIILA